MRFNRDSKTVTLVNKDGTVRLWSIENVLLKNNYFCDSAIASVDGISFSPNENLLAYYSNADPYHSIYLEKLQEKLQDGRCYLIQILENRDSITHIGFSPDGKWLASAGKDKTVELWSVDEVFNSPENDKNTITRVKYSPNGKTIAIGHADNTVELRQNDGNNSKPFPADSSILSFSPDGKTLATGSTEDAVTLWNRDQGKIPLKGHINNIKNLNLSPDGQMIVVASGDNKVELWRTDGTLLKTLTGYTNSVESVKFSPDSQIIAAISGDEVVLWHRDGSLIKTSPSHTKEIKDLVFSPNSQFIASFGNYNQVDLWRTDGRFIKTLQGHTDRVTRVSFSPDSKTIASVSGGDRPLNSEIRLWRSKDGLDIKTIANCGIEKVSFSPNGKTFASINADNTVKLWSFEGNSLGTLKHNGKINSLSFSPDSKMLATASDDSTVKLWKSNDGTFSDQTLIKKELLEHTDAVTSVSFSPDGKTLASASKDNTVRLWRSSDGSYIKSLSKQSDGDKTDKVGSHLVSFSRDGKLIISASSDWSSARSTRSTRFSYTVKIWRSDGSDDKPLKSVTGHGDYDSAKSGDDWSVAFKKVGFSTDGKVVAIASRDHAINLWHLNGTLQATLTGNNNWVNSVSFSPDGKTIASASDDGTIKLWRSSDGKFLKPIGQHSDKVNSVSFSPDGKTIASASDDKTVKLWNINGTPYQLPSIDGHSEKVNSVRFSPDGKTIAYGSESGTVRLWNISDHKDKELPKPDNTSNISEIDALDFSKDSKWIALGGTQLRNEITTSQLYIPSNFWFKSTQLSDTTRLSGVNFSPSSQPITVAINNRKLLSSPILDELMRQGCGWVHDYLKNNPKVSEDDRHLCNGYSDNKSP